MNRALHVGPKRKQGRCVGRAPLGICVLDEVSSGGRCLAVEKRSCWHAAHRCGLIVLSLAQAHDFPYPLSLSALGVLTSAIFSRGAVAIGLAAVRPESVQFGDFGWAGVALPVGACKAATLAAGNAVYLHLGLGFIQMLKAWSATGGA